MWSIPVVPRDSFITDPFFVAARETLEKSLRELTLKHRELQSMAQAQAQAPSSDRVQPAGKASTLGSEPNPTLGICNECNSRFSGDGKQSARPRPTPTAPQGAAVTALPCPGWATGHRPCSSRASSAAATRQVASSYSRRINGINSALTVLDDSGPASPPWLNPAVVFSCRQPQPQFQQCTISEPVVCTPPGYVSFTTNHFELVLDVHGFQPNEVQVAVKDNSIEVNVEHKALQHPTSMQSISKRYKLPYAVDTDMVQCSLSNDGVLVLTAPWKC